MTKDELIQLAEETGKLDRIDKRWGINRIAAELGVNANSPYPAQEPELPEPVAIQESESDRRDAAQDLAMRIWDGQSPDLKRAERIRRIEERLGNKGYDASEVVYP